jgi:murein DD-endopeptidase MepM/ murein hydrolase activator NlpD
VADTLATGQTLAALMADRGFDPGQVHEIAQVIREHKPPRTLRPGAIVSFTSLPGAAPHRLELKVNPDTLLHLTAADSGWSSRVEVVPVIVDTLRLAGLIRTNLWEADLSGEVDRLGEDEFQECVYDLAEVFAWKVDFTRDLRSGDGFRIAMEREVRPDGSLRSRRFLAIELRNRDRVLSAIPFTGSNGRLEYFDRNGEALRGVFLRYPVPYRITSGFSNRRFHPVLKRSRPHQGIDYGAPHGAIVRATASGTVARAGTWSSYGRMVEIRHPYGITTRYAHLSSLAVRPGARVEQGQIVGRVGATGLASGTHLHYEFIKGGRHRNPLTVELPSSPALEAEHLIDFHHARDAALALLDDVAIPALPPNPLAMTSAASH